VFHLEELKQLALSLKSGCSPYFSRRAHSPASGGHIHPHSRLAAVPHGRFVVAAEAGVPIVPVSIHGTRSILRADHWFPRRGVITITISKPNVPDGKDWAAAIRLWDAARTEMLRQCGEPDLAPRV